MELVFNTRTSRGKVTKNARVRSNDPTKVNFSIDFTAQIMPDPDTVSTVRFSPARLEFDYKARKLSVTIENHDSTEARLDMINSMADDVKARIKDDIIKAGKTGKLEFQWKGDTLPEYDQEHVITFNTGIKGFSRFSIPYVIKGQKGSKSGHPTKQPEAFKKNGSPPSVANRNKSIVKQDAKAAAGQDAGKSNPVQQQYNPDSVKVDKPLPGTEQWPPR